MSESEQEFLGNKQELTKVEKEALDLFNSCRGVLGSQANLLALYTAMDYSPESVEKARLQFEQVLEQCIVRYRLHIIKEKHNGIDRS